jgi:hypothetical protein
MYLSSDKLNEYGIFLHAGKEETYMSTKHKKTWRESYDDACANLAKGYAHYRDIYHNGSTDAIWADGTGLDLTRTHILVYRARLEELCGSRFDLYPVEYFMPVPHDIEFPQKFNVMTRWNEGAVPKAEYRGTTKKLFRVLTPYEEVVSFDPVNWLFEEVNLP